MNRFIFKFTLTAILIGGSMLAPTTVAAPIDGHYQDDSRGDAIGGQVSVGELGDATVFSAGDGISYHTHRYTVNGPVSDDGIANDWTVHMTNMSGIAWRDLFFVADLGAAIGNADGKMEDAIGATGKFTDAFRIDNFGINANLLEESISQDGIFQPGESWEFAVVNFGTGAHSLPPELISPGVFAGSSPMVDLGGTNASILATPVPEPTITGIMAILLGALTLGRPSRH